MNEIFQSVISDSIKKPTRILSELVNEDDNLDVFDRLYTQAYETHDKVDLITTNNFLSGCCFYLKSLEDYYTRDILDEWQKIIELYGGHVVPEYDLQSNGGDITHFVCSHRTDKFYKNAFLSQKRIVTQFWLEDVLKEEKYKPPWRAYHFPAVFNKQNGPLTNHVSRVLPSNRNLLSQKRLSNTFFCHHTCLLILFFLSKLSPLLDLFGTNRNYTGIPLSRILFIWISIEDCFISWFSWQRQAHIEDHSVFVEWKIHYLFEQRKFNTYKQYGGRWQEARKGKRMEHISREWCLAYGIIFRQLLCFEWKDRRTLFGFRSGPHGIWRDFRARFDEGMESAH